MARVPPPRHDIGGGLWIPGLREGSFSPLTTCCQSSLRGICPSQGLPTPRLRRCGLSVTSPIRFPPCGDGSSLTSSRSYRAARAAERKQRDVHVVICDAVVLAHRGQSNRIRASGDRRGRRRGRISAPWSTAPRRCSSSPPRRCYPPWSRTLDKSSFLAK